MQSVAASPKVNWCQVVPNLRRRLGHKDLKTTQLCLAGSESHGPHVRAAVDANGSIPDGSFQPGWGSAPQETFANFLWEVCSAGS